MQIREADIQDVEDIKNLYLEAFDNSEAELVSNASIADTTSHIGIALTLSYFYNTSNFSMNVEITSASVTDKSVIRQMMELYQYDFSEFTKADLNEHGHFGYPCLDNYWVELNRNPFLIRVNDKLAGFVLVHQNTYFSNSKYHLAEFFILRKYRKQGIGRQVAFNIFDLLRGDWEIYQAHTNLVAKKFWQNVIQEYTAGTYTETVMENDGWNGIVRCFDNTKFPS